MERTFVMIKPLGLLHALPVIIKGLQAVGHEVKRELVCVSRQLIEQHYADHAKQDFFPSLIDRFTGATVMALVFEGDSVISAVRNLIGPADPRQAAEDQIRHIMLDLFPDGEGGWRFTEQVTGRVDNLIHASDSPAAAEREIALWFPELAR